MYLPTAATPRPSWPCCTHLAVLLPPPSSASPDGWNSAVRWWPSWPRWVITSSAIHSCARRWRRLWSIWGNLDFCSSIGHYLKREGRSVHLPWRNLILRRHFFISPRRRWKTPISSVSPIWGTWGRTLVMSSRAKRRISGTSSGSSPRFSTLRSSSYIVTFLILFNLIAVLNKKRTFLFNTSEILDKKHYICVIQIW